MTEQQEEWTIDFDKIMPEYWTDKGVSRLEIKEFIRKQKASSFREGQRKLLQDIHDNLGYLGESLPKGQARTQILSLQEHYLKRVDQLSKEEESI